MRYIPDELIDAFINSITDADEIAVCSSQPVTYYNACRPPLWIARTSYTEGDLVHPPDHNGCIYQCTSPGTSDTSEPAWPATQDATCTDGTVTWKTHKNYALINTAFNKQTDAQISDNDPDGRKSTIAQKMGVTVHTSGTVTHTALINNTLKKLTYVTIAETDLVGNNQVTSGRTTLIHQITITVRDPAA